MYKLDSCQKREKVCHGKRRKKKKLKTVPLGLKVDCQNTTQKKKKDF